MHYCCSSSIGFSMKVSLEYMIVELGILGQPFQKSYMRYKRCMTHSWLKSVWEKCRSFEVLVAFGDVSIELPRVGGHWLMVILAQLGYSGGDLMQLNRVRVYQQILFFSCILMLLARC